MQPTCSIQEWAAQFSLPDGSAAVLIRHDSKQPELFVKTWEQIHARHVQGRLQVVAVGGEARDDGPRELMRRSLPSVQLGKQLQVFAIDESGAIWAGPRSRASRDLQASLDAVRRSPGQARIGSDAFRSWLGEQEQAAQATREAVQRYQASLASRRPTATTVLAVSIAAVFLLELLWGATDSLATMVKMGAVVSEGPEALAPWRILACSFLHGGIYHLAGNLVVLWLIGGFLERLIGPWRLLALWTLSVAGGSAAALLFSEATVMVGASGGG